VAENHAVVQGNGTVGSRFSLWQSLVSHRGLFSSIRVSR
jgi:hypothetical protein